MTDEPSSSATGGPPAGEPAEDDADSRTLTHLDASGRARMVDVSAKPETLRTAIAAGHISIDAATRRLIAGGALPKGDVLTVARVAAVMAAKRTGELIPLCHPIPLTDVQVDLALDADGVAIRATASCIGRTGVEMEALTAVTIAALTIYDMCKSADRRMVIGDVHLVQKSGGRSGEFRWLDEAAGGDAGSEGGRGRDAELR